MGAREEQRLLNRRGHAPKLGTSEFTSLAGVTSGWVLSWDDTAKAFVPAAPGGIGTPGAPDNASYVTLSSNASLTNERVLNPGAGLTLVDGGTSAGVTIDLVVPDGDGTRWNKSALGGATVDIYVAGQVTGGMIVRGSGVWEHLTYGSSGQFLRTRGAGYVPAWTSFEQMQFTGQAHGDIIYRDAGAWALLPAGTSGQVLSTGGVGAAPSWTDSDAIGLGFAVFKTDGGLVYDSHGHPVVKVTS